MTSNLSVWTAAVAMAMSLSACSGPSASVDVARSPEAEPAAEAAAGETAVINHTVTSLEGETVDLGRYRGSVMLIVNTASECGYTPQYAGLEELYQRYKDRGLVVVGFPSNDFGNQEPGDAEQIATFCRRNYGVTFPMMAKVHTKGPDQSSVYATLTEQTGDGIRGDIGWNFTKFLVDREGRVVARFESRVEPLSDEIVAAVEGLL